MFLNVHWAAFYFFKGFFFVQHFQKCIFWDLQRKSLASDTKRFGPPCLILCKMFSILLTLMKLVISIFPTQCFSFKCLLSTFLYWSTSLISRKETKKPTPINMQVEVLCKTYRSWLSRNCSARFFFFFSNIGTLYRKPKVNLNWDW